MAKNVGEHRTSKANDTNDSEASRTKDKGEGRTGKTDNTKGNGDGTSASRTNDKGEGETNRADDTKDGEDGTIRANDIKDSGGSGALSSNDNAGARTDVDNSNRAQSTTPVISRTHARDGNNGSDKYSERETRLDTTPVLLHADAGDGDDRANNGERGMTTTPFSPVVSGESVVDSTVSVVSGKHHWPIHLYILIRKISDIEMKGLQDDLVEERTKSGEGKGCLY